MVIVPESAASNQACVVMLAGVQKFVASPTSNSAGSDWLAVLTTTTSNVPSSVSNSSGMVASSSVELLNVVDSGTPSNSTTDDASKFKPVTVRSVSGSPCSAESGSRSVITGTAITSKSRTFDAPPPGAGVTTSTSYDPGVATSAASIAAVTRNELTNVVVLATPSKYTTEVGSRFEPFTVSVKSESSETVDG